MLKISLLSLKLLKRELRAGEWTMIFMALFLAVAALTSIHFYTDRIMRGLTREGAKLIGGDLVISSASPIPSQWEQKAREWQLQTAAVWAYPSVVSANNQLQLVNIQAVDSHYPLLGNKTLHIEPGFVWVEARLLPLLSVKLNEKIAIGAAQFTVKNVLTSDVDSLNTGWTIAPRVMVRLEDIPATRTVVPGSRVDYRLLLTGDETSLQTFRAWVTPQLSSEQVLLDIKNQPFALSNTIERITHYFELIVLVCLLMSGVAIALSVSQYFRRHVTHIALWRCLGAQEWQIVSILCLQLFLIAVLAGLAGTVTGYLVQTWVAQLFQGFIRFSLPSPGVRPWFMGFFTSIFLLFAFSLPMFFELAKTPPLSIWKKKDFIHQQRQYVYVSISLVVTLALFSWFMHFSLLANYFILFLILMISLLFVLSRFVLYGLKLMVKGTRGVIRIGLNQVLHFSNSFSLQFIGFNLIFIALITSVLIKMDLTANWETVLIKNAPNYFAFNLAKSDIMPISQFFKKQAISVEGIYPMVRGRLIALNDKPILTAVPPEAVNNNALHRDLNLSWMWEYPSDNKLVRGENWTLHDFGKAYVSVEAKLASDLNLHLKDKLIFQIGEKKMAAEIINLRSVQWSSIHPNFFMIFPPGLLDEFPATYITSFHLDATQTAILNEMIKTFPNVTIVDMANVLTQIQDLTRNIISAMQYLLLFCLGLGVLIFITSVQANMDERRQTYSLVHILGAGKNFIRQCLITEFITLALVIVPLSIVSSIFIVMLLEKFIFNL